MDSNSTEFIAEAQEVIETFSRGLLEIEAQSRSGALDPDLINAAFRAVHSLKGLAGLFGATAVGDLSHALENTLDSLRLGKLDVTRDVLDVLFEAIELFGSLLESGGDPDADLERFLGKLQALTRASEQKVDTSQNLDWIGDSILGVLTEYEEHRLRENLRAGRNLFRVHAAFDILAIDVGIETLKDKLKAHGEVITYLPSVDGSSDDSIELDILVGSDADFQMISAYVADQDVTVHLLAPPGKDSRSAPAPLAEEVAPTPFIDQSPEPRSVQKTMVDESVELAAAASREEATPTETSLRSLSQTV
ncbi:MAG: Hpt domain-containing protein, partial [Nannocystaceae bacterium]